MGGMSGPQFSRPGAIDLSALRTPATAPGGGAAAGPGGLYSFDVVGEESLRTDVVERSLSVVVLASFWSAQSQPSIELTEALTRVVDEFAGKLLLARIDVGEQPELAQALGIPQVPLVVAALRGQLAPLLEQSVPEAELRAILGQVVQAATANGVVGVAEPVGVAGDVDTEAEEADEPPSRFPEAEDALMSGDIDGAIAAYEAALLQAPGDEEAVVGLARAKLVKRSQAVDLTAAREAAAASPNDVDAQTLVADLDLLGGHVEDAFLRLIDLVRRLSGDDRDAVRKHLVEMFAVVGDEDPRVPKARQQLASALF